MRHEQDGLRLVKATLYERLRVLEELAGYARPRDFAQSLIALRKLAASYGLITVVHIAEATERTLGNNPTARRVGRGAALYLDRLYDAIGCDRIDDSVSEAMIASVSVRLGA